MNRGTLILVIAALASVGGAWAMRPKPLPPSTHEDTGEPLFKDFTDPTLATSLEVAEWNEEEAQVVRFAVKQKEGRWVIPSHNDYPADGTERMGQAAASFIDIKKDIYLGDNPADHGKFGLLDPDGAEGKGDERGKRITIKDASDTVLVDIIVGKAVEGKQGMMYVRYPEEKRVYASKLELKISTSFTDWIEKDLLHVDREEIVRVEYDPYQVDEEAGKVVGTNPIVAVLGKDDKDREEWQADTSKMMLPPGKVLDNMKVKQIATAVANVKIVGVRPRPDPSLPPPLQIQALQGKGFFVTESRALFGNEGRATVITKDGVVYTLLFGEVTYESGFALSGGVGEGEGEGEAEETSPEGEEGAEGEEDKKTANRYMFVNVAYDPGLDQGEDASEPEPEPDPDPEEGEEDKGPELRGMERAKDLGARFNQWFYVISDTSFKQIHKERDEMFKDAPEEKDEDGDE